MNKKILLMFTFIFSFLILKDNVFAVSLLSNNYTLECIYEDGGLYTEGLSTGKGDYVVNRTTYNLSGTSVGESNKGGDMIFANSLSYHSTYVSSNGNIHGGGGGSFGNDSNSYQPLHGDMLTSCAENVNVASLTDDNDVSKTYYAFGRKLTCGEGEGNCDDFQREQGAWCAFWGCQGGTAPAIAVLKNNQDKTYNLVSERYLIGTDYPEPNDIKYYVMPAEQKIGSAIYIRIYIYDNVTLLEKEGRVTRITDEEAKIIKSDPKVIYLNSPEPIPVTSSNSVVNYKFNENQKIYSISTSLDNIHTLKFEITDSAPDPDETGNSLCTERLKNTSPVLKSIIQIGQILLPALVIILTGLDIGKIVITGNVEEELPKRKKTIINRAIVLVILLFLPLLVKVMLKIVKSTGSDIANNIEYIDCLFDSSAKAGTAKKSSTTNKSINSKNKNVVEEK